MKNGDNDGLAIQNILYNIITGNPYDFNFSRSGSIPFFS